MPNPKRRHSRARRNKRRTHDRLAAPAEAECPQCNALMLPHRACQACGFYKGREVIETSDE